MTQCGREFVNRNLNHTCGPYTADGFLEGKKERAGGGAQEEQAEAAGEASEDGMSRSGAFMNK